MPRVKVTKKASKKPTDLKGKVFGVSIVDVCQREEGDIPQFTKEVIEYLETNGLDKEGLFRIPGNAVVLEQLKSFYDGENKDISLETCDDVHAVACLLKLYLRELPEPVLSFRFYETFISIQKNPDVSYRLSNTKKLLKALPVNHKNLLIRLCEFLNVVAQHSEQNKMGMNNLAIVLGPNLLRPRHESMLRMVEDSRHGKGEPKSKAVEIPQITISGEENKDPQEKDNSKSQNRKPVITEDVSIGYINSFDIENPLSYAMNKLREAREDANRPFDIKQMTIEQVKDEKNSIKWELRNYDLAFHNRYGHFPSKREKEPLRPLYDRYRLIVDKLQKEKVEKEEKEDSTNQTTEELTSEKIEELKLEKKELQKFLHKYQTNFAKRNRRPVQFVQDREPVKKEYLRYKELKGILQSC